MDNLSEFRLRLKEVKSSIVVLQHAVQNDNKVSNKDIENHLEIIIEKMTQIIDQSDNLRINTNLI